MCIRKWLVNPIESITQSDLITSTLWGLEIPSLEAKRPGFNLFSILNPFSEGFGIIPAFLITNKKNA